MTVPRSHTYTFLNHNTVALSTAVDIKLLHSMGIDTSACRISGWAGKPAQTWIQWGIKNSSGTFNNSAAISEAGVITFDSEYCGDIYRDMQILFRLIPTICLIPLTDEHRQSYDSYKCLFNLY